MLVLYAVRAMPASLLSAQGQPSGVGTVRRRKMMLLSSTQLSSYGFWKIAIMITIISWWQKKGWPGFWRRWSRAALPTGWLIICQSCRSGYGHHRHTRHTRGHHKHTRWPTRCLWYCARGTTGILGGPRFIRHSWYKETASNASLSGIQNHLCPLEDTG